MATQYCLTRKLNCLGLLVMALLVAVSGCGEKVETEYGSTRGDSLNGTGTFAELLRRRGHEVRTAWRLTDELGDWADVIVRFAGAPGPPDREEAGWYEDWLESESNRSLVYVVRDYDAETEYWSQVIDQLSDPADADRKADAMSNRDRASRWVSRLPSRAEHPADAETWFATDAAVEPPAVCKKLGGPFADGVDAGRAALDLHSPLKVGEEEVLLTGDGKVLAMAWEVDSDSRVLAIASGVFLLNLPLVNPERRVLAERVASWIGEPSRKVAFVEGFGPTGGFEQPPDLWDLIRRIEGFRWAAIQFGLFGLLACLAKATRLGRPRPEPASDADRPAAHAEALGALLQRSRAPAPAQEKLAHYRRWRFPRGTHPGGTQAQR
jgi:hypothetical protein